MPNAPDTGCPEPNGNSRVAELLGGILGDVQDLVRQQLVLFGHEVRREIQTTRDGLVLLAAGAAVALVGAVLILLMTVYLLYWAVPDLPLWVCYAAVGIPVALAGAALCVAGLRRLRSTGPRFDHSVEALHETVRLPSETLKEGVDG